MDLGRSDRSVRLDALAAQYALGTLSPRARQRMARVARGDAVVAAAIAGWEQRLGGLAEAIPGTTPSPRIWQGIQSQLGLTEPVVRTQPGPTEAAPRRTPWWASLGLWRGLALANFAVAFALAVTLFGPRAERPDEAIVAVLAGADAQTVLIASADRSGRYLTVKAVAPVDLAAGRALELWALPEGKDPRSLGLIPAAGMGRLALAAPAGIVFQRIPALAVSVEPAGGSPTGKPSGPVLYSGKVLQLY